MSSSAMTVEQTGGRNSHPTQVTDRSKALLACRLTYTFCRCIILSLMHSEAVYGTSRGVGWSKGRAER